MVDPFCIEWKSGEGYGDFITGLCYAHSSTIKYERPVVINFHWPNGENELFSDKDFETIKYRFDHILSFLRPVENLTIKHTFSSKPNYRFINELEEFNPLHGLWYPKQKHNVEYGLVCYWSSIHNISFPGLFKDPAYNLWPTVLDKLKKEGFCVAEVTYRTPIKEAMEIISKCEFGIGYDGLVHQLFKFMWKPLIVAAQRKSLVNLLIPQSHIVTNPQDLLDIPTYDLLKKSEENIKTLKKKHFEYLSNKQDPTKHGLYNKHITTCM